MVEADQLLSLPSSFPFKLTQTKTDLRRSKEFTIHRQGLDMDMVATTNNSTPKEKKTKTKYSDFTNWLQQNLKERGHPHRRWHSLRG